MKHIYSLLALLFPFLCACTGGGEQHIYHSESDVSKGTIGVLLGSSQDKFVTENYPEAHVLRIDMATNLAVALKAGTCDAALFGSEEAKALLKEYPEFGVLEDSLCVSPLGIGFRHEDTSLRKQFNAFLAQLRANGTYTEMQKRWLSIPGNGSMPSIPLTTSGAPLRIGTTGVSIPFSYIKNGKFVGLDMELVYRFAAQIGRPAQVEVMDFGALIPALTSGKLDLIANYIMITPERAKEIAFSEHYDSLTSTMLARKDHLVEKATYSSIAELKGKRMGVLMGSTHDDFITNRHPEIEVMRMESISDLLQALLKGRCEAVMEDEITYNSFVKKNKGLTLIEGERFSEDFAVGFNRETPELREAFNAFLKEIRENGVYDEIYNRWLKSDNPSMPQIELSLTGMPIRVGTSAALPPFSFIKNGDYAGMDVELMRRFAQKIGRPVEFNNISFGALIAALTSGKVDMIASSMAITKERAQNIAFSDSYFTSKSVFFTLAKSHLDYGTASTSGNPNGNKGFMQSVKNFIHSIGNSFRSNLIVEQRYLLILEGLKVTVVISIFSALLGTLLGAGICYLRMNRRQSLRLTGHLYITMMRGTPVLVFLMLMYYVVFARWDISATTVAILAFAMNFAAYVSEMFRSSISGVDRGQTEAGIALGFTPVQTFVNIVMPQAVRNVLPIYKGELISLVKMTSIVGYIAVEDLTKASDIIRSRTFDAFFPLIMIAVIYFMLAWLFSTLLDYLNHKHRTF